MIRNCNGCSQQQRAPTRGSLPWTRARWEPCEMIEKVGECVASFSKTNFTVTVAKCLTVWRWANSVKSLCYHVTWRLTRKRLLQMDSAHDLELCDTHHDMLCCISNFTFPNPLHEYPPPSPHTLTVKTPALSYSIINFVLHWRPKKHREPKKTLRLVGVINERSEFFRSLSEKSEYERPGPAQADAFERLISPRLWIRLPCSLHREIGPFKLT